jgi:mono/diheme cytochrome c family protein
VRSRLVLALGAFALLAGCSGSGTTTATTTTAAPATTPTTTAATFAPASSKPPKPSASIEALVPATRGTLAQGRKLFQANARPAGCAFCHTMRAAANTSPLGPSLDAEMSEADLRAFSDAELAQNVREWVHDAPCLDPADVTRCMPSDSFMGQQADVVSVFVAVCGRKRRTPGCAPVAGGLRGEALEGRMLFQTRGCVGCHFSLVGPSAGPSLYGVAGSKVTLDDGTTLTADDAYLTESIATPDRKIVNGFPRGLMSSRVAPQHLTKGQIHALVAYVKTLK